MVKTIIAFLLMTSVLAGDIAVFNSEAQDLSAYYGFEEIEIVKLDWGIKVSIEPRELIIADVTGDDKDDVVTIIHDRVIIYPQD